MRPWEERHDPDGDAIEAQERADRIAEKGLPDRSRSLWETAVNLSALKEEHSFPGASAEGDDITVNQAFLRDRFAKLGLRFEDSRAVAAATSVDYAQHMVDGLMERGTLSRPDLEAALALAFLNVWIDGSLVMATFLKQR
jgi:hypothetical protein